MSALPTIDLLYPIAAAIVGVLGGAATAIWVVRAQRRWAIALLLVLATIFLAVAAGGLRFAAPGSDQVLVLVDLSPSTRGASYREPGIRQRRIEQLLSGRSYEIRSFGDGEQQTTLPVLDTRPVLLFSDGQFELPASAPPIYPVLDPNLENPADAHVIAVKEEMNGRVLKVRNTGPDRSLVFDRDHLAIAAGEFRVRLAEGTTAMRIGFAPGDLWPENDQIMVLPPAPPQMETWSSGIQVDGARPVASADLPAFTGGYSSVAAIVLQAGDAALLTPQQQAAMAAYVRELGGTLVLFGPDARWSELRRSTVEALSPVAVDPPEPQREWVLLLDASGSMAQQLGPISKWDLALQAGQVMAHGIPQNDLLRTGAFGRQMRWWTAAPAGQTSLNPPAGFAPGGPTDLAGALQAVLSLGPAANRGLLLITDAEVDLPESANLLGQFREQQIQVNCLALSDGRGRALLQQLCQQTGGQFLTQPDPKLWTNSARELSSSLAPQRWEATPQRIALLLPLGNARLTTAGRNQVWHRPQSKSIAQSDGQPAAALWSVGLGQVASIPFPLPASQLAAFAQGMARTPADAQFTVRFDDVRVEVEQMVRESTPPRLQLRILSATGQAIEQQFRQTHPRRFEAKLPTIPEGGLALVCFNNRVLARRILQPRYPQEFTAIGNNHPNLQKAATQTGGQLVLPDQQTVDITSRPHFHSAIPYAGILAGLTLVWITLLLRRVL